MSGFFCLTFSKYSILSVFILPSNQNLYWVSLMHWRKPTRSQGEPANSWDLNSATHCSANIQTHRSLCYLQQRCVLRTQWRWLLAGGLPWRRSASTGRPQGSKIHSCPDNGSHWNHHKCKSREHRRTCQ